MMKFFVNNENIVNEKIKISGSDVNHIKNVLRMKVGEKIEICNNETSMNYICTLTEIEKNYVIADIVQELTSNTEGNVKLHIFQGLPKADKMELIIQKGTELGVSKFVPVQLKRSIVKISGKDAEKKLLRWQKIAEVAAKQCKRDIIPDVSHIVNINDICEIVSEYDLVLLCYEEENENYIKNELQKIKNSKEKLKIAVIIGPEGGMAEEEVEILEKAGAKVVSLGKRILRTETVALMVSSIIMYELEK